MADLPRHHRRVDLDVDGARRWYLVADPEHRRGRPERLPVVVDLHGYAEGALRHATATRFADLGLWAGFRTVTPQGSGMVARWDSDADSTDSAFIDRLLDRLAADPLVDPGRIFLTGMSSGGAMAVAAGSRWPIRVAGIAPVAGMWNAPRGDDARRLPAIVVHGTEDAVVRWTGGILAAEVELDTPPIQVSVERFAAANGCQPTPVRDSPQHDVRRLRYRRDAGDEAGAVDFVQIVGGGHTWPGGPPADPARWGRTSSFPATRAIWEFFASR